jgi:hypothetical protein
MELGKQDDNYWKARFVVNNIQYACGFEELYQGNSWIVDFMNLSQNVSNGNRFGITNTGSAGPVYSTVLEIIHDFRSKNPTIDLLFSTKEPSRIKLYNRMIKTYPGRWSNWTEDGERWYEIASDHPR